MAWIFAAVAVIVAISMFPPTHKVLLLVGALAVVGLIAAVAVANMGRTATPIVQALR